MNAKIEAAKTMLGEQGRRVESVMHMGKRWFQIDCCEHVVPRYGGGEVTVSFGPLILATPEELEELAEGFYSFDEFKELLLRRRADEARCGPYDKTAAVRR